MITSIFTTILLFMPGFGIKKKPINVNGNDKINKSNPDKLNKAIKNVKKVSGKVGDSNNLKALIETYAVYTGIRLNIFSFVFTFNRDE